MHSVALTIPDYVVYLSPSDSTHYRRLYTLSQVDGIRGAVLANRKVPGDSFGGTLISHNKGGQWSPLQAPAVDRNGLPTSCFPVTGPSVLFTYILYIHIVKLID